MPSAKRPVATSFTPRLLTRPHSLGAHSPGQALGQLGFPLWVRQGGGGIECSWSGPCALSPGRTQLRPGLHGPLSLPSRVGPTETGSTYRSGLGHLGDQLRHGDGAGPGGGQAELLGLCDLGLALWRRGLAGQLPLQLVDQLLDFRLPPQRQRWEQRLGGGCLCRSVRGRPLGTGGGAVSGEQAGDSKSGSLELHRHDRRRGD